MYFRYVKILLIIFASSLLNACGGGGGGGGSAGGGASYTVNNCSDTGTAYQTYEYYNGGSDLNQNAGNNSPLQYVCASSAYARNATGNGIQVAVVDTGINASHSEIDSNMVTALSGSDTINSDDNPTDDHGHGTHVAGIIAGERAGSNNGTTHGVAYNADIYAIKIFNSSGNTTNAAIAAGYALVEATGAIDIINNSWGTNSDCSSRAACRTAVGSAFFDNWEDIGQLATPKISVFAAGNDGEDEPSLECQTIKYDADLYNVSVCVVATSHSANGSGNSQGKGKIATFSNKCGSVSNYCIAAPGDGLWNLNYSGGHTTKNGTSMAAPMVSGGLAIIMEEFSSLTPAQVVSRLFTTANDSSEYSQSSTYGHGMMNLNAATTAVAKLQTINGSNFLDDPNTSYNDLVNNTFKVVLHFQMLLRLPYMEKKWRFTIVLIEQILK